MWRPHLVDTARLKYLGIVDALEADIRAGRVTPGERLPPQRAIAEALGVDLTTVTRALNEAQRRGLVSAQVGRGTFVRDEPAGDEGGGTPLDLSMNIPPQPAEPDLRRILPQGIASILTSPRGTLAMHYQESTGAPADRTAAASWLTGRVAGASADRIVVTSGAQAALFALCALLLGRGDVVAAGAVTYPGLKAVAAQQRLELAPVAMDEQGILPEAFEAVCRERAPKLLYLIPSIDNPTTATLPADRRRELAAVARRHGVLLIEDDPYASLRSERLPALAELAPELTWHIATLSKCATPALRIAYVLAPNAAAAVRLATVLRSSVLMAPPIFAALATRWITDGTLTALASAIRAENRQRQSSAASIFSGLDFAADPDGHHLWLHLPQRWRAAEFADHAERAGLAIVPASAFAVSPHPAEAVRISLGIAPDRGVLEEGLTQLSGLLTQPAVGSRAVV
ncbi:PLP-dependent aminotransferase family protein [Cereibacter sphaeroides]|uniref:PLP-dependent aminotransferase family protein n=1 Tax=Cereibacter sphaeroides TaxID=1063 RepID=A0AAX1UL28_CERSP|nr:PLP-dependent aminotransferase family protein [Cereibacter sphaeroides]RHZ94534.1 PLP-dependent aminotransferase family protein [Cereibacter sphaeroides]